MALYQSFLMMNSDQRSVSLIFFECQSFGKIYDKIKEKLGDAYMVMDINGYRIGVEPLRNWGNRLVPVGEWFILLIRL